MSRKQVRNYDVGYRKPPKSGQFKPGQSGNPAGRPKGSKNLMTHLVAEANEIMTVTIDGKVERLPKIRVMTKQLLNSAIKGDARARQQAFDLLQREYARADAVALAEDETRPINVTISPTDAKL